MKRGIEIFLFFFLASINIWAEEVLVNSKKMEEDLYVYDSKYHKLVPLINKYVNTVHLIFDSKLYNGQYLHLNSEGALSVFVDNQIYKTYPGKGEVLLSVNDLTQRFGIGEHLITFYSPIKLNTLISSIYLCTKQKETAQQENEYQIINRSQFIINQSVLLGIILLFVLFYAIQNGISPQFFKYVYNPLNLFKDLTGDDLINISRLDSSKLVFVILDSFIISFIYSIMSSVDWNPSMLPNMLMLAGYVLLAYLLKYIYSQIVAYVFRVNNYSFIQVFQFLRLSMVFSLIILCLYLILCSPFTYFSASGESIFNILLLIFLILYIAKVIFSLKKIINLRSFYFISYICVSELIPVILFLVYYFSRIDKGIS